ncbi:hypothetical protein [Nocardia sp. CC227C]|uniref:hypothetical protein n=1 Tax=Nocardia sp. CC227C TaxID=3044562 RepID=UPI00278C25D7|nr:hypothetical protein [Nocardia sp. CC227C]
MGMSLSADVFWGFDLGYDDDIDDEAMPQWRQDGGDWEEVLARKLGWNEVPYPTGGFTGEDYRNSPEYRAWSASRDEMYALVKACGVEIDGYGYECGGNAVRVKASVQSCLYGAEPLKPLDVATDWADQISRFCELLEIPIPDEGPGWHVCATWA